MWLLFDITESKTLMVLNASISIDSPISEIRILHILALAALTLATPALAALKLGQILQLHVAQFAAHICAAPSEARSGVGWGGVPPDRPSRRPARAELREARLEKHEASQRGSYERGENRRIAGRRVWAKHTSDSYKSFTNHFASGRFW